MTVESETRILNVVTWDADHDPAGDIAERMRVVAARLGWVTAVHRIDPTLNAAPLAGAALSLPATITVLIGHGAEDGNIGPIRTAHRTSRSWIHSRPTQSVPRHWSYACASNGSSSTDGDPWPLERPCSQALARSAMGEAMTSFRLSRKGLIVRQSTSSRRNGRLFPRRKAEGRAFRSLNGRSIERLGRDAAATVEAARRVEYAARRSTSPPPDSARPAARD